MLYFLEILFNLCNEKDLKSYDLKMKEQNNLHNPTLIIYGQKQPQKNSIQAFRKEI